MASDGLKQGEVISNTLEKDLSILSKLTTLIDCSKSVALMIRNMSKSSLCNPSAYPSSGKVFKPLPYTIDAGSKDTLGFEKTAYVPRGAEGVVVYQLENTQQYLCIFYSVPFIGSNGFYLKWKTGRGIEANETLFTEMANEQWEIYGGIKWHTAKDDRTTHTLNCRGFMTQTDGAQMIVDVMN
ncbi:deep-sea actinoporin Cjtox I-like [Mytilus trossulus]|uniref:deep-sea actinoporin Cjtox I-like n=1 Tax=Mytilus trossulus TaxID=6551 RepID=UPI00300571BA